jgi:hypothetical protein
MSDAIALKPRLLNLKQVREACGGIGRDMALATMHAAGATRLGRRLLVHVDDLEDYLRRKREEGSPG